MIVYITSVNCISPAETQAVLYLALWQHKVVDNPYPEILLLNET